MYDKLLYKAYGHQLDEADERLRELERELQQGSGDRHTAEAYLRMLARTKEPAIAFYLELVDLLKGSISYYKNHRVEHDYQFRGFWDGHKTYINISISKVRGAAKAYLSMRGKNNRNFIFAEMSSSKGSRRVPSIINLVRGYSIKNTYGDTLAGWPKTSQNVWINKPSVMLNEMSAWLQGQEQV